jgi:hypothetical protein
MEVRVLYEGVPGKCGSQGLRERIRTAADQRM